MSKPRPDLPNSKEAALEVVRRYMGSGLFTKAYIVGSRSPKNKKSHRKESDWDFYFLSKKRNVRIPSLRLTGQLHGDVVIVYEKDTHKLIRKDLVEIYPDDKYGILNENT